MGSYLVLRAFCKFRLSYRFTLFKLLHTDLDDGLKTGITVLSIKWLFQSGLLLYFTKSISYDGNFFQDFFLVCCIVISIYLSYACFSFEFLSCLFLILLDCYIKTIFSFFFQIENIFVQFFSCKESCIFFVLVKKQFYCIKCRCVFHWRFS